MILVDTSVWIDHLRLHDAELARRLEAGGVLGHPFVIGELALGGLGQRDAIIAALGNLPSALVADAGEVLEFIDRHALAGRGVGYVDAHLLAAVRLTPDAALWTRDRRLERLAAELSLSAHIP